MRHSPSLGADPTTGNSGSSSRAGSVRVPPSWRRARRALRGLKRGSPFTVRPCLQPALRPNILLIMTDQERYPPPYEDDRLAKFREDQLGARESLREGGLEFHRHYAGSTACTPSRATLFTGQYPSLHGVTQTDGTSKKNDDPAMMWLDPDAVPTLGDWFRAGGYQTHYRGKWHVSLADLLIPGTHEGLMASDDNGKPIADAIAAYRKADRLDPFGFSGWIGREPHGATRAECGAVRDGVFAEQVVELFGELAQARDEGPWLAVSSFVNPHDIAAYGVMADQVWKLAPPDDTVPEIPEAPSQSDSFAGRPACQEEWTDRLATDALRAAGRRRLPSPLLLPAEAGRSGDRPHPRRARQVGHGRRHHRRVHLRPRRHARRARRHATEVVQRVRRIDPRAHDRQGPRRVNEKRWDRHAHQPRRFDPDADGIGRHRPRTRRRPE